MQECCTDNGEDSSFPWMAGRHTSGNDRNDINGSRSDPKLSNAGYFPEEEPQDQNLWPRWDYVNSDWEYYAEIKFAQCLAVINKFLPSGTLVSELNDNWSFKCDTRLPGTRQTLRNDFLKEWNLTHCLPREQYWPALFSITLILKVPTICVHSLGLGSWAAQWCPYKSCLTKWRTSPLPCLRRTEPFEDAPLVSYHDTLTC